MTDAYEAGEGEGGPGIEWGSGVFAVRVPRPGLGHPPDPDVDTDWYIVAYLSVPDPAEGFHFETWFTVESPGNSGGFSAWANHRPAATHSQKSLLFTYVGEADPDFVPDDVGGETYVRWSHGVVKFG